MLMVHSSLRSLGAVPGGAETVVRGILDALGPAGTLLVPALSYLAVNPAQPCFEQARTPSCVGALPEFFRTRAGTRRSLHPTHSVCAAGARAGEILGGHHLDSTPCGPRSPFRRLREFGGQVLFLGCGMRPNTSMHAVEELVVPPYLFAGATDYRLLSADGGEFRMSMRNHGFAGWEQRYDRLACLLPAGALRFGAVLGAGSHLVACAPMWQTALAALRADPLCFVERLAVPAQDTAQASG
jgi:aminoglycoside 3-N-acetyltransferase